MEGGDGACGRGRKRRAAMARVQDLRSNKSLDSAEVVRRKMADKDKELHPSKVRSFVVCGGCGRRRCIFAKLKPSEALLRKLDSYLESVDFSCGDALFPDGVEGGDKALTQIFFNAEGISCRDLMAPCYFNYGGLRGRSEFLLVCARCGNEPDESPLVVLQSKLAAKMSQCTVAVALPLCSECFDAGEKPVLCRKRGQSGTALTPAASEGAIAAAVTAIEAEGEEDPGGIRTL